MVSTVRKNDAPTSTSLVEFVMDSNGDLSFLPTNKKKGSNGEATCLPGSLAYTQDLEYIYILSPSGIWVRV